MLKRKALQIEHRNTYLTHSWKYFPLAGRQAGRTNALSHITLARTILSDDNGRNAEYGKITFTYWSIVSEGDNLWPNWGFNVPNSSAFNGHFMYMSGMEQQRPESRLGGKRRWKENKSTHFHIHFTGNNLWPIAWCKSVGLVIRVTWWIACCWSRWDGIEKQEKSRWKLFWRNLNEDDFYQVFAPNKMVKAPF